MIVFYIDDVHMYMFIDVLKLCKFWLNSFGIFLFKLYKIFFTYLFSSKYTFSGDPEIIA